MATFTLQPRLQSELVNLRPLMADDWDTLFAAASDPLIWSAHPANDRWKKSVFRHFFEDALASDGALVATDPASHRIIGTSRYDIRRAGPGEIEIGWTFLSRDKWGGATNAAMKWLMIRHALSAFDRVIFFVAQENIRSRRAMEKVGGTLTDRSEIAEVSGRKVPHIVFAIDRSGFANGPLSDFSW